MFALFTAAVVFCCVAASLRRVYFAIAPTPVDPTVAARELRGEAGRVRYEIVARAFRAIPHADWEHAVLDALARPAEQRTAAVNEQLGELDYRLQRWARVPRVCARVCVSAGFLFAALSLRDSLSDPDAFSSETRKEAVNDAIFGALNCAALGIAGTSFCVAAHARARKAAKARQEATDKLVERLEALSTSSA